MNLIKKIFGSLVCFLSVQTSAMILSTLPAAAQRGDTKRVQELINLARAAGKLEKILSNQDWGGWTALHWAASRGHSAIVRLLLSAGADPNVTDIRGSTPLHEVIYNKHIEMETALEIIAVLIAFKANVNWRDSDFWSPLCLAARRLDTAAVIQLLEDAGARDPRPDSLFRITVSAKPIAVGHRPEQLPRCPY